MACDASSWLGARARLVTTTTSPPNRKRPRSSYACTTNHESSSSATPRDSRPRDRRFSTPRPLPPLPPPPRRRWVYGEQPTTSDAGAFVLMSYNILGDNNARNHPDLYWNVPRDAIKWDCRKALICREIGHWNPDLVCLQEVDRYGEIAAEMRRKGYASRFKGRSGDAKDGCAIFWIRKRFHLLQEASIDYSASDLRNNVAQLLVFELHDRGRFVLGNIHVLFNPRRGDIKLGQIRMLLVKAKALSRKWGGVPIVLAGDFNSTPESAIYGFLSKAELDVSFHDRRRLSGLNTSDFHLFELPSGVGYQWSDEELRNATGHSENRIAEHPLKLSSSYATVKGNARTRGLHGEPLATSYHLKFLGTVDYLWYSTGFKCSRVLDTLPIDVLKKTGGLPTREMGSDHLPVVAEFFFPESRDLEEQKELDNEDTSSETTDEEDDTSTDTTDDEDTT